MTTLSRVLILLTGVALSSASLAACNGGTQVGQTSGAATSAGTTGGGTTTGSGSTGGTTTGSAIGRPAITAPGAINPNPCEVDVDFGPLVIGLTEKVTIMVTNTGKGVLDLSAINPTLDPAFQLTYPMAGEKIQPGSSARFSVTFQPYKMGQVVSTFAIPTDGANPQCPAPSGSSALSLTVQLTGNGVQLGLRVEPNVLDFGNTLINTSAKKSVMLVNTGSAPVTSLVAAVNGGDSNLFVVGELPAALAAGGDAGVDISYAPLSLETRSLASVVFNGAGGETATLDLFGEPVGVALTLSPNPADCGYVPLDTTAVCCTTVADQANVDVKISGTSGFANAGGAFAVSPTDDATPPNPISFPIAVAAGDSAQVCFSLTPTMSETYTGQVTLDTDDPSGTNPIVELIGWGGGPQITCMPTSLDFGPIAGGQKSTLPVTCTNTGTALPGIALTLGPLDAGPGAFSAAFDATMDPYPDGGLDPGQSAQIDVTYTPIGNSNDMGSLVIPNNGGQGTTLYIPLSGSGTP